MKATFKMASESGSENQYGPEDIPELRARLSRAKGVLTRHINSANRLMTTVGRYPSEPGRLDLLNSKTKIEKASDNVQDLLLALATVDEENAATHEAAIEQEGTRADEAQNNILQALSSFNPAEPVANQPDQLIQRPKPIEALRPFILTLDHSPADWEQWQEEWKAYYEASNLQLGPIRQQQAYFRKVINSELLKQIQQYILPATPIYGQGGCIELIEQAFCQRYPQFNRRLNFFRTKQAENQKFSEWTSQLRLIARGADLHTMTPDDIFVMRYISGCTDEKLRQKLMQIPNPTSADLDKAVAEYECSQQMETAIQSKVSTITAKTSTSQYRRNKFNKPNNSNRSFNKKMTKKHLEGRCWHCGLKNHKSEACKRRDNLHCSKCNRQGHIADVCISGSNKAIPKNSVKTSMTKSKNKTASTRNPATPKMSIEISAATQHKFKPFTMMALPDSGTTRTLIAHNVAKRHGLRIDKSGVEPIEAANATSMPCEGSVIVNISCNGITTQTNALVSSALRDEVLISWHDLQRLKVLPANFPAQICATSSG